MIHLKKDMHIFFIGIGGVGMSALALILKEKGYKISGSDRADNSTIQKLSDLGIGIFIGHSTDHIIPTIDYVVYTNAVDDSNPEVIQAKKFNIPLIVRAEMLNFIGSHYYSIGVSGTHGKTTTTSMTSRIFLSAGLEPTLAVGGFLPEIQGSGYSGSGRTMIYEACEAFGSLKHLHPDVSLVTNIDEDHLEFFQNRSEVEELFLSFFNDNLSPQGLLIWNADDACLKEVVQKSTIVRQVSTSLFSREADFWVENLRMESDFSSFEFMYQNGSVGGFTLNIPGIHNVSNAILAIAAAKIHGIDNEAIVRALENFKNANRRFEIKSQTEILTVIDDYAHHPKAVELTLEAARKYAQARDAKLVVVFQPHLYSRTRYFYKEFSKALTQADAVVLTDIYAARETNDFNISSQLIYDEINKLKPMEHLIFEQEFGNVCNIVKKITRDVPSVVVTLGAGDIWKVSDQIIA